MWSTLSSGKVRETSVSMRATLSSLLGVDPPLLLATCPSPPPCSRSLSSLSSRNFFISFTSCARPLIIQNKSSVIFNEFPMMNDHASPRTEEGMPYQANFTQRAFTLGLEEGAARRAVGVEEEEGRMDSHSFLCCSFNASLLLSDG